MCGWAISINQPHRIKMFGNCRPEVMLYVSLNKPEVKVKNGGIFMPYYITAVQ